MGRKGSKFVKIFIGLGNPGVEYAMTRHNIGFMAIDYISKKYGIAVKKSKFKALYGEEVIRGEKLVLVQPMTYMNLSGESVRQVLDWYKPDPQDFIIIYDDMDIPLGKVRLRVKGSAGGHNGMKSIIQHLGTQEFLRIRMGVGRPGRTGGEAVISHVLSAFTKEEQNIVTESLIRVSDAAECILDYGFLLAMNHFNT